MKFWQLYETINAWLACYGYPPTVRELRFACGWCSTSTVEYWLWKLHVAWLIRWQLGMARTIKVVR